MFNVINVHSIQWKIIGKSAISSVTPNRRWRSQAWNGGKQKKRTDWVVYRTPFYAIYYPSSQLEPPSQPWLSSLTGGDTSGSISRSSTSTTTTTILTFTTTVSKNLHPSSMLYSPSVDPATFGSSVSTVITRIPKCLSCGSVPPLVPTFKNSLSPF